MRLFFLLILGTENCIAQSPVMDGAGREVRPPAKVERVYAAGPPAGLLVFAIAPEVVLNAKTGLWWAGKLLYPQSFDVDLRAKVAEFHRLFYHREPTAAQLDAAARRTRRVGEMSPQ